MENMTTPAVYNWRELYNDSYNFDYDYEAVYPYKPYEYVPYDPKSLQIMSTVIFSVVCVLGVLGNGVVIWATGFRMKKTVSTEWYLNLAVADFLVTAFLTLKITYRALDFHWPFGWLMCKMEALVFVMNMYGSIFILAVISVDRCVCVVRPVWARRSGYRTVRKAYWVSLAVWVLALALSTPHFIFRDTRPIADKVWCYDNYALWVDYGNHTPKEDQLYEFRLRAMVVIRFVVGFVVPFSIIVSCYFVIIYRLRNNRSLASQSGRSFKIVAIVIAAFFLCWIPYHIIRLIYIANIFQVVSDTLTLVLDFGRPITFALALLNSCLNPLLYVFSQGFRDVFRSRSILKVLEKAFAEEPPQTNNTPTDPDVTRQEIALSETLVYFSV